MRRHGRPEKAPARTSVAVNEQPLLDDLQRACRSGDAKAARNALGRWMRRYGPGTAGMGLQERAEASGDARLASAVRALEATGFAPGGDAAWSGDDLWSAVQDWRRTSSAPVKDEGVTTDLYAAGRVRP